MKHYFSFNKLLYHDDRVAQLLVFLIETKFLLSCNGGSHGRLSTPLTGCLGRCVYLVLLFAYVHFHFDPIGHDVLPAQKWQSIINYYVSVANKKHSALSTGFPFQTKHFTFGLIPYMLFFKKNSIGKQFCIFKTPFVCCSKGTL